MYVSFPMKTLQFNQPVNRHWQCEDYQIAKDGPIVASQQGLPIGTGKMGSMVWTLEDSLCLQVNRVDVYPMNGESNSFYQRNTDYCGACGIIHIKFKDKVFAEGNFQRQLDMKTGLVQIETPAIKAEVFACPDRDVFVLKINDLRPEKTPVELQLKMLREPNFKHVDHTGNSTFSLTNGCLSLQQHFYEGSYNCQSLVSVQADGNALQKDEMTAVLELSQKDEYLIYLGSAASFEQDEDLAATVSQELERSLKQGWEELQQNSIDWWAEFWEKNPLELSSSDGKAKRVEEMYYFYLYCMACASRGNLPPKFNGMNWISYGDVRPWGVQHWWHNVSCFYRALHAAGSSELGDSIYNMYWKMRGNAASAAEHQWGSKGLFFSEITSFDGPPPIPGNIAQEMQDLYLYRKPWEPSAKFLEYAHLRNPRESRWNWKFGGKMVDGKWTYKQSDTAPSGPTVHLLSSNARIAWQFWMRYQYSMDKNFLINRAYPIIKGTTEFFRNFPGLKMGDDGRYHIHHLNLWEYRLNGTDPMDCVASMIALTNIAIRAAEILDVDLELRKQWCEFRKLLPEFPTRKLSNGKTVWVHCLDSDTTAHNTMFPVSYWPDIVNPESANEELLRIAQDTLDKTWEEKPLNGQRFDTLDGRGVATAVLGRKDLVQEMLPALVDPEYLHCNGFSPRESAKQAPGTTVQCHGVMTQCLQIALCASLAPEPGAQAILRPFHAWPEDWNAKFAFRARGNFMVSGEWKDKAPVSLEIKSLAGETLRMRPLEINSLKKFTCNGIERAIPEGELWEFSTQIGDVLNLF